MEWKLGFLGFAFIHAIFELETMDSLILAIVNVGSILVNLGPFIAFSNFGILVLYTRSKLNWLIVSRTHLDCFFKALVGPETGCHVARVGVGLWFEQVLDHSSILHGCSTLEKEYFEILRNS
jgi:hypothetical protein